MVPSQSSCSGSRPGRVACDDIPVGRVCGTPIGMAISPTVSRTANRSTTWPTAATKRSHWVSGSGPVSSRNEVPSVSVSWCTTSSGAW